MKYALFFLLLSTCAFSQVNESIIKQEINSKLPTNNTKSITAANHRALMLSFVEFVKYSDTSHIVSPSKVATNAFYRFVSDTEKTLWNTISSPMTLLGVWNANTNTPTLSSGSGWPAQGRYYTVSVAGTQSVTGSSTAFVEGDWIASTGTSWVKVPISATTLAALNVKAAFVQVNTYAAMVALGTPSVLTEITVLVDENKGNRLNTIYKWWPSGKRIWVAGVDDN